MADLKLASRLLYLKSYQSSAVITKAEPKLERKEGETGGIFCLHFSPKSVHYLRNFRRWESLVCLWSELTYLTWAAWPTCCSTTCSPSGSSRSRGFAIRIHTLGSPNRTGALQGLPSWYYSHVQVQQHTPGTTLMYRNYFYKNTQGCKIFKFNKLSNRFWQSGGVL